MDWLCTKQCNKSDIGWIKQTVNQAKMVVKISLFIIVLAELKSVWFVSISWRVVLNEETNKLLRSDLFTKLKKNTIVCSITALFALV